MRELDVGFVREQFPAFSEESLVGQAFFENAGGSYACKQVIDLLSGYYTRTKVQPYYPYAASARAGEAMDAAYGSLAGFLNVGVDEVFLGPSTSQNTYVLAQAFRGFLRAGDEIIVTNQDHEANGGVWRRLASDGVVVREWGVNDAGLLETAGLEALLNEKTRLVAFPHCSNIVGEINPVRAWVELVHAAGAVAVVDGVSYAGHGFPDVRALGADVYLFSLYKTFGPHQGVMVVREELQDELVNQSHYFNDGVVRKRLVPAGPDHAQVAAAKGVTDYFEVIHAHHFDDEVSPAVMAERVHTLFRNAEQARLRPLLEFLGSCDGVRVVGRGVEGDLLCRAPTVSVLVDGVASSVVVRELAARGVMCGFGHFYAARLLGALGVDLSEGVVRFSFVHYTTDAEVQQLISALGEVL